MNAQTFEQTLDKQWKVTKRPPNITRSFEFDSYDEMRDFLDDLAELSEQEDFHPNLNFTRSQVNITIQSYTDTLGEREYKFAKLTETLLSKQAE